MLINKNTDFTKLQNEFIDQDIEITKDVVLDKDKLIQILHTFPHAKITILSGYDQNQIYSNECLYDEEEVKVLADNINMVRSHFGRDLLFDDMFSVEEAISASNKINEVVRDISSARVDNKPLSPYEKFLWAYEYVTKRIYEPEDQNDHNSISRNLISVLNGDKIVCVGYASLLTTILNRVGVPCTFQTILSFSEEDNCYGNHATCCVRIDDPKYKKHGVYYSDPTNDRSYFDHPIWGHGTFNSSLLTYKQLKDFYKHPVAVDYAIKSFVTEQDLDTAVSKSVKVPKILSYLFPEKTQNKTQDEIIKETARKRIESSNIHKFVSSYLNSITPEQLQEDYLQHADSVTSLAMLVNSTKFGEFDNTINFTISSLASSGFTPNEIKQIIKNKYTEENLQIYLQNKLLKSKGKKAQKLLVQDVENTISKLSKIDVLLNSFNYQSVEPYNPETAITNLVFDIANASVNKHFFCEDIPSRLFLINILLRQGFELEDIKTVLKNQITSPILEEAYTAGRTDGFYESSTVNERELYATNSLENAQNIYNEPYKEEFAKLKRSAKPFTNNDIFSAILNINLARGHDFLFAQKKTFVALSGTDLPEPKK